MNVRFLLALGIAVIADIADIIFLAWLPIVGDILDVMALALLFLLIGKAAVIGLVELVPFADFLPMHSVAVIMSRKTPFRKKSGGDILG